MSRKIFREHKVNWCGAVAEEIPGRPPFYARPDESLRRGGSPSGGTDMGTEVTEARYRTEVTKVPYFGRLSTVLI